MNKRKHDNGEPRVEGEWDAEVRIKKNNDTTHRSMRRKVKTVKVLGLSLDFDYIASKLRNGYEVILRDYEKNDAIWRRCRHSRRAGSRARQKRHLLQRR